ncbi:MAG: hypothetical protein Q8Q75_07420 [Rhodoferax sp.]|uniref:hypothetical protein n=1 Tax=Rhodoferax sp. TaxID=50421 RepID=UPI002735536A|nr:hypothetical protein [Rhodoferax sp.]MDP3864531.1 hypothetical protein [Rhodoferax sp.]
MRTLRPLELVNLPAGRAGAWREPVASVSTMTTRRDPVTGPAPSPRRPGAKPGPP